MNEKFNKLYYKSNNQDKDRLGILFYYNVIKTNFRFSSFLDFGCGVGHLLKKIEKNKTIKQIYGYEVNEYAVNEVNKNTKNVKVINSLDDIKEKIDLATLLHVVEHINDEDLIKIFEKIKLKLTTKGRLLIATPAKNGLAHQYKKDKWIGFKDSTHINIKTHTQWINFFEKQNFKLIKSSSDGLWDFPYKNLMFSIKFLKIMLIMVVQIISGKLFLNYNQGETFLFILKSND